MIKDKLDSAESCLEVIEILFNYYSERWKKMREKQLKLWRDSHFSQSQPDTLNKKIVDDFYGNFLVDLEATFKEKFP